MKTETREVSEMTCNIFFFAARLQSHSASGDEDTFRFRIGCVFDFAVLSDGVTTDSRGHTTTVT